MAFPSNRLHSWLQLVRAPNLLTVPGDPLAGLFLASDPSSALPTRALLCPLAAILFYGFGMVLNDYRDLEHDRRTRPARPLPSGQIKPSHGLIAAFLLAGAGLGLCAAVNGTALLTGAALVTAICAYNLGCKHIPLLGPLTMGSCRALSLLLGAAALGANAFSARVIFVAAGLLAYTASITAIAAQETRQVKIGLKGWLPALAVLALALILIWSGPDGFVWREGFDLAGCLALAAILLMTMKIGFNLRGSPAPEIVSGQIGRLIMAILPLQAAMLMFSDRPAAPLIAAGLIFALWPSFTILSRRFYAS